MQQSNKSLILTVLIVIASLGISAVSQASSLSAERFSSFTGSKGLWSEQLGSHFTPETQVRPQVLGGSKLPTNFVATDRTHSRFTF